MDWQIDGSVDPWIGTSVDRLIARSMDLQIDGSGESVDRLIARSMGRRIARSVVG